MYHHIYNFLKKIPNMVILMFLLKIKKLNLKVREERPIKFFKNHKKEVYNS